MKRSKIFFSRLIALIFLSLIFSMFFLSAAAQDSGGKLSETSLKEKARNARLIFVRNKSRYVNVDEFEAEFLKQPEIKEWGLLLTREELSADLIIEIHRKRWTRTFTIILIDPRTNILIAGGKIHDTIFENVEHSLVRRFVERMGQARAK